MSQEKPWWEKASRGQYVCEICGEYIKERKGEKRVEYQEKWISTGKKFKDPPIMYVYDQQEPSLGKKRKVTFSTHVHKKCLENKTARAQKCPILLNYHTDKSSRCIRYISCNIQERTNDPKCPAKGQK